MRISLVLKEELKGIFDFLEGRFKENFFEYSAAKKRRKETLISLFSNQLLIDVGASYFSPRAWKFALSSPTSRLIAIDPNGENLNYLSSFDSNRVTLISAAVSRKSEIRTLYKTNMDSGSSLFKPIIKDEHRLKSEASLDEYFFPCFEEPIKTLSLLEAIGTLPPHESMWLKLDTQGSELEILQGFADVLQRDSTMVVELEVTMLSSPIMAGSGKASDTFDFLEKCGFEILTLQTIYSRDHANSKRPYIRRGFLNECDIVFTKKLTHFENWNIEKKVSLFLAYLSYGHVDLAFRVARRSPELKNFISAYFPDFIESDDVIKEIESIL